jgi:hypothetical protein
LRELPVRAVEPSELNVMLEQLRHRITELQDQSEFGEAM